MKQLKVLIPFREANNFFLKHEKGDVIVTDDNRAALLIREGLCEEHVEDAKPVHTKRQEAEPEVKAEAKPVEANVEHTSETAAEPTREPAKRTRKTNKK